MRDHNENDFRVRTTYAGVSAEIFGAGKLRDFFVQENDLKDLGHFRENLADFLAEAIRLGISAGRSQMQKELQRVIGIKST